MRIVENKIFQACVTYTVIFFAGMNEVYSTPFQNLHIAGIMVPDAFRKALQDGMSIPLYIHLNGSSGTEDDQRIGTASIWLDDNMVKVRLIELEDQNGNAALNEVTRSKIDSLKDVAFNEEFKISLTDNAWLYLNFQQLTLQIIVTQQALKTLFRPKIEDIGKSSAENLSGTLSYNFGIYNNKMKGGESSTSNYLSFDSVTALKEHHLMVNGTMYGLGSNSQQAQFYRAMYERDFSGFRLAGGMLDAWNLQSLGSVTALPSGKIYGFSWGNYAQSTVFNDSHSVVPVIVFLPSAGEVHLSRDGKLLSVQNFSMGSHEVDTSGLPYGIYDIKVDVIVNGQHINQTIQRVNKLFARGKSAGMPFRWQFWGGNIHIEQWESGEREIQEAKNSLLIGLSTSGTLHATSWIASAYNYDSVSIGELQLSWPVFEDLQISLQNMLATDGSWSSISSLNATLPGRFSTVWLSQEKTSIGKKVRRSDATNISMGASLNLNTFWSRLGSLSASYNKDHQHNSHYYTADYTQTLYNGQFGSLGLRAGLQRYQHSNSRQTNRMQKYVAFDFLLPLGSTFRAGITQQNGYAMANISAQKQFDETNTIQAIGADLSRGISGEKSNNKNLSATAWTKYESRFSTGTLSINSGLDGYLNSNFTANGSVGWQGKELGVSGSTEGNAGVILHTDIEQNGQLTARVNGRLFPLLGKRNYLPLDPYSRYEVEIINSKKSIDSYNIANGKKGQFTLYPGNVVTMKPEIKQMVTVSGRIRAEDGTLLAHAHINNHIGRTRTDGNGEFVMDIDKKFPTVDFSYEDNKSCEANLDISNARGAVWVGDIICQGLKTFAGTMVEGETNEG